MGGVGIVSSKVVNGCGVLPSANKHEQSLCGSDPIPLPVLVTSTMDHNSPLLPSLIALLSASLGSLSAVPLTSERQVTCPGSHSNKVWKGFESMIVLCDVTFPG